MRCYAKKVFLLLLICGIGGGVFGVKRGKTVAPKEKGVELVELEEVPKELKKVEISDDDLRSGFFAGFREKNFKNLLSFLKEKRNYIFLNARDTGITRDQLIDIVGACKVKDAVAMRFAHGSNKLKKIDLSGCKRIGSEVLGALLNANIEVEFIGLRELDLSGSSIFFKNLNKFLSKQTKAGLNALILQDCKLIKPDFSSFSNLKKLDLSRSQLVVEYTLFVNLPNSLEKLILMELDGRVNIFEPAINKLNNLRELNLVLTDADDNFLRDIFSVVKESLEELYLSGPSLAPFDRINSLKKLKNLLLFTVNVNAENLNLLKRYPSRAKISIGWLVLEGSKQNKMHEGFFEIAGKVYWLKLKNVKGIGAMLGGLNRIEAFGKLEKLEIIDGKINGDASRSSAEFIPKNLKEAIFTTVNGVDAGFLEKLGARCSSLSSLSVESDSIFSFDPSIFKKIETLELILSIHSPVFMNNIPSSAKTVTLRGDVFRYPIGKGWGRDYKIYSQNKIRFSSWPKLEKLVLKNFASTAKVDSSSGSSPTETNFFPNLKSLIFMGCSRYMVERFLKLFQHDNAKNLKEIKIIVAHNRLLDFKEYEELSEITKVYEDKGINVLLSGSQ